MFEGLDDFCPPAPVKDFLPSWFKEMDYFIGGRPEQKTEPHQPPGKTMKACPAINDLFKYGYVVPAWCDFSIVISEHGGFEWFSANPRHEITFHPPTQLSTETTASDELNFVVKFVCPWRVSLPKGHLIMMKGVPYHHQSSFRVCEGIIDASVTSTMNINTFWSNKPGTYLIKRGQPLALMMPFKIHSYELQVHSDTNLAKRLDERNKTLMHDTFENTYKNFAHKSKQK